MRKKSLIIIVVLASMAMTACLLGDDIETLEKKAAEANLHGIISLTNIPSNPAPMFIWINFDARSNFSWDWHNGSHGENGVNFRSRTTNLSWYIPFDKFGRDDPEIGKFINYCSFPADLYFRVDVHFSISDNDPRNYYIHIPWGKHFDSREEATAAPINLGTVDLRRP